MGATAKHIIVTGKVQGVFFRKNTKQKATELALDGWVKNTADGNVEIFAQGENDAIEQLVEWCWQGSPRAKVEDVQTNHATVDETISGFSVEH